MNLFVAFQYISCYCLSCSITGTYSGFVISIHLMLLFIFYPLLNSIKNLLFQYISCYCLSKPFAKSLDGRLHFNTSHVTVYLLSSSQALTNSCISIHLMLLFIQILVMHHAFSFLISIHLMLLFIKSFICFKTAGL